ncbi:hypothetical protein HPG69_011256 [Diceros bicornis minor]|uniref:Uncharacterized protein n=1 Tax=Diceros bicornis minor TaxID=77932 RepID=A0A7J7FDQ4_DICBM|nr:hypothetical protein HPG69_011256 [Diceros bicornis minor]
MTEITCRGGTRDRNTFSAIQSEVAPNQMLLQKSQSYLKNYGFNADNVEGKKIRDLLSPRGHTSYPKRTAIGPPQDQSLQLRHGAF